MNKLNAGIKTLLPLFALTLMACGGGGGGGGGGTDTPAVTTGSLSLEITDAPVDEAFSVVVEFDGVELQPAEGDRIIREFEPRSIDLLQLTDGLTETLLNNESLPGGQYSWIRLMVNAEPNVQDSYIQLIESGEALELQIPSGAETGLKINRGFLVPTGGSASFTIDFDLRKSIHKPGGNSDYKLRPTLRMIDNAEVVPLNGTIEADLLPDGACEGAVYVFTSGATADDFDGTDDAITSAAVKFNDEENACEFSIAFMSAGDYLLAFTASNAADEPDEDNFDPAVPDNDPDGDLEEFSFITEWEVTLPTP
mgnify:CR=1 FL=1